MTAKPKVAALEGWFTLDAEAPRLLGSRCKACGTVYFPKQTSFCRNPACEGTEFEEAPLSRRGRVWSFTNSAYPPPPPFVVRTDPFVPVVIAAVELEAEKMVVLGQVVDGVTVDDLSVGMEMELVLDTLYEDDEHEYVVWKWRPVAAAA